MSKSILRTLSSASFLVLVVLAWWLLAPPPLAGRTSYAVIYGTSMEPHFHAGDLVLMRQEPDYQVGQIVGYHSERLGKPVMHRIVKIHDGRYTFKGDNNNFLDPEHPVASQLFGREWVRLPIVGSALEKLHTPRNAALLGGLAALFVLLGGGAQARKRRRRTGRPVPHPDLGAATHAANADRLAVPSHASHPPEGLQPPSARRPMPAARGIGHANRRSWMLPATATLAAIGLASVAAMSIIGIVAYTRPLETVVTQTDLYIQRGAFGYSASAPVGAVYDHSRLHAGDALFPRLVHSFDVKFNYGFQTLEHASISGQGQLYARLTDGRGWSKKLPLAPATRFSGQHAALTGSVDLDRVTSLVATFEKATGEHSTDYQLLLMPNVAVHGVVGDQLISEHFTPTLTFDLTENRLRLATGADGANQNTLVRTRSGTGTTKRQQKLGALGVSTARRAALIGLPTALIVALLGGGLFLVIRGNDEVALIRRRYGAWLIDVAAGHRSPQVERRVESIDVLARIAERYERLILHEQRDRLHSFLVEDDGLVYRYDAREKTPWHFDRVHAPTDPASGDTVQQGEGGDTVVTGAKQE